MYCDRCGAELDRGQTYCGMCGAPVQEPQPAQNTSPSAPPPQHNGAISGLVIACTVLIMLLIGLGLVASGVISINGSENAQVEKAAASQGTAKGKNTESSTEAVVIKETPDTSGSDGTSSKNSNSSHNTTDSYQPNNSTNGNKNNNGNSYDDDDDSEEAEPAPSSPAPSRTVTTGYVFPDSAERYLSTSELYGLDNWTLCIARNEIYARHGRGFVTDAIQAHFYECPWYTRTIEPEDFVEEEHFNDYEYKNALTIRDVERAQNSPYL